MATIEKPIAKKEMYEVIDPWTGEVLDYVPIYTEEDVKEEINRISHTRNLPIDERLERMTEFGAYLEENSEYYADLIARESGMPISNLDLRLRIISDKWKNVEEYIERVFGHYGNDYKKLLDEKWILDPFSKNQKHYIRKIPKGIYLFIPANTDSAAGMLNHSLDLILGNNKVVVKPGTKAPLSTIKAIEDMKNFGLGNYVAYVNGPGQQILGYVLDSGQLNGVLFIGKSEHGLEVHKKCAEKGIHFVGDYEGNNYMYILNDAVLSESVSDFIASSLMFNGLACFCVKGGSIENRYQEFEKMLLSYADEINTSIGDPRDKKTKIGPLLSKNLIKKSKEMIEDATNKGAKIIAGGEILRNPNTGEYNLMPYTILKGVNENCDLLWEETPGPVVWVEEDFEKALRWGEINEKSFSSPTVRRRNGLRYVISTRDGSRAREIAKRYKTALISLYGMGIDPIGRWGGTGKTSTLNGCTYLIDECVDTQSLYLGGAISHSFNHKIEETKSKYQR